ncbi:phosphodiester glycosidase family protein [Paenibacillus sp. HB172176]|uniref:phosphodiester glycosidase family protein n=1 Tax=Paenibacillus sp. HB172176 TaxID=2493690 RepID=UPI0014395048|nr:phosphodiester glycosidase family protein [Paenibacillus sp. HB172176]
MNLTIKRLNRTALLAISPFIGAMLWLLFTTVIIQVSDDSLPKAARLEAASSENRIEYASTALDQAQATAVYTGESIKKDLELYNQTNARMAEITSTATAQAKRPLLIYDKIITSRLGKPAATISSNKLRAQLFYLSNENFRSYAVKIQLKSDDAMKLVLGGSEVGKAQTTLQAVNDYDAAVGINGGGFADGGGKRYPLSTTIVDGNYIMPFQASYSDLFFVGLNDKNELIGGKFSSQTQLDALKPKFGASFVPVLLKNGYPQIIPSKWQTSPRRAPRTVIANYKDDQLLLLVADGYNEAGSSGATLAELQTLLKQFGAVDAYNLDGGGSSSLVFNGKIINKPSDGALRKVPTNFLFFK